MTIYKPTVDTTHFRTKKLRHAIETATLNPQNHIIQAAYPIGPPPSTIGLYSDEIPYNYIPAHVILPVAHDFLPKHCRKSGLRIRLLAPKKQAAEQHIQDRKIDNNFIDDRLSSGITSNTTSLNLNTISAPTTTDFATSGDSEGD